MNKDNSLLPVQQSNFPILKNNTEKDLSVLKQSQLENVTVPSPIDNVVNEQHFTTLRVSPFTINVLSPEQVLQKFPSAVSHLQEQFTNAFNVVSNTEKKIKNQIKNDFNKSVCQSMSFDYNSSAKHRRLSDSINLSKLSQQLVIHHNSIGACHTNFYEESSVKNGSELFNMMYYNQKLRSPLINRDINSNYILSPLPITSSAPQLNLSPNELSTSNPIMAFPLNSNYDQCEIQLYDGTLNRNTHNILLLRPGFYGLRLMNQNRAAWDSLYFGLVNMKIVLDFEILPKIDSESFINSRNYKNIVLSDLGSFDNIDNSEIENSFNLLNEVLHKNLIIYPESQHNSYVSLNQSLSVIDAEFHDPLTHEKSSILEKEFHSFSNIINKKMDNVLSSDATSLYTKESLQEIDISSIAAEVLTDKGQVSAKAQQERYIYFYVDKSQKTLQLNAYASCTLGMKVKCNYTLLYCGIPKLIPSNSSTPFRNVNILCLDGGGFLGISSLKILERIEVELQKKLDRPEINIIDYFDLICGTSTGGIIILGLLTGLTVKDIINLWSDMSNKIFEGNRTLFSGLFFEGYDVSRLKSVLTNSLGRNFLNTYTKPFCFVTSTNVKHNPYELFLLRNYSHRYVSSNAYRGTSNLPVWAAAWATSAAPTYLKGPDPEDFQKMGFKIDPEVQLCDGALKANNPTIVALEEAARLAGKKFQHFIENDIDCLLSIGTGQPTPKKTAEKPGNVSTFQILLNSSHLLTSGTAIHRDVLHWFNEKDNQYFRFNVPGVGDLPLDACDKSSLDLVVKATRDYLMDEKYYDIYRIVNKLAMRKTKYDTKF